MLIGWSACRPKIRWADNKQIITRITVLRRNFWAKLVRLSATIGSRDIALNPTARSYWRSDLPSNKLLYAPFSVHFFSLPALYHRNFFNCKSTHSDSSQKSSCRIVIKKRSMISSSVDWYTKKGSNRNLNKTHHSKSVRYGTRLLISDTNGNYSQAVDKIPFFKYAFYF